MSKTNTGGPVFASMQPNPFAHYGFVNTGGLSIRDYFAAKAMQADLTYQGLEGREDVLHVALMSYEMADAMIKAREGKA